jgi:predicted transcriptional regulator
VYEYVAGKADWVAMDMPTEGVLAPKTIRERIRKDVPTCGLNQELSDINKVVSDDWNICVVIDSDRIVLGILDLSVVQDVQGTVEELMKPAPPTLRPSVLIDEAEAFFEKSNREFVLVTKSTGQLIGIIRKTDLENDREGK